MRLKQRIRVHVASSTEEEKVLEMLRGKLRSRLLTRLCGNQYAVLLLVPTGKHVKAVEIVESNSDPP